jgi:hypothetical protein
MSLTIPLAAAGSSLESRSASGFLVPVALGLGGGTTQAEDARQRQVLRAVAAAAAVRDPAGALTRAKAATDNPASVIGTAIDPAALAPVLQAVARLLKDRTGAPKPTDPQLAAARAINADAELVAAADQAIGNDAALKACLDWVAVVDTPLLDRAARAGATEKQLDLVPAVQQEGRLDQIDAQLKGLETRLKTLEDRLGTEYRVP